MPRFILSLGVTFLPAAMEDCIITGAAIAAAPAVLMKRRLEKELLEFIIHKY
jgi:hypothetical protein